VPIYEYACTACRHRFEVKQKMSDSPLTSCERCGEAITKIISAPAIMFKGSGWYITDYSDKMKTTEKTDAASAESNGKKDSKSDAASSQPGAPAAKDAPAPATPAASTSSNSSGSSSSSGSSGTGSTPTSSGAASKS